MLIFVVVLVATDNAQDISESLKNIGKVGTK